jgi:uncharacterized protein (TIGR01319 family)
MSCAILIDFGSTYTKVAAVSLENKELICTSKAASTVETDARIGLEMCLDDVRQCMGNKEVSRSVRIASSSAAGGLRMVVVGLTQSLSMKSGKNAALGAGARVIKAYSGVLTDKDVKEIEKLSPEIILLCGGTEGGNSDWPIKNACAIAENENIHTTLIYAGNSEIASDVKLILSNKKKECLIVKNILPDLDVLDVEPAGEAIRNVFMKRIVNIKGLDIVKGKYVSDIIMPTPAAVLAAGALLADGTGEGSGMGSLMIFDIGGATTDVHSFATVSKSLNIRMVGAPEPYAKRTVEGDLGLRSSAKALTDTIGWTRVAEKVALKEDSIAYAIERRITEPSFLPNNDTETIIDLILASGAAYHAARRHAGERLSILNGGAQEIQRGKDLNEIEFIVGTGGPIIHSRRPASILEAALSNSSEPNLLLPKSARLLVDRKYILYAAGLLSQIDKSCALAILKNNLEFVT